MILILSKAIAEYSTEDVIDWLHFYKSKFLRINGDDIFSKTTTIKIENSILYSTKIANIYLEDTLSKVNVVWFRRWKDVYKLFSNNIFLKTIEESTLLETIKHVNNERRVIDSIFFNSIESKKHLSHTETSTPNKLLVLQYAAALGLKIPNTIVTNCKKDLFDFLLKEQEIIIKPLSDAFTSIIPNEISLLTYTSKISKEKIEKMDDWFFTSMFQGLIKKKYEIRVFYLEPNFYSMAIFSQNDEKTTLDFRNYNDDKPNRNIPYKLPIFIEDKLRELMKKLNLQTGSIDLIKSYQNDYVFLEVNPVGQFGMTSKPCNYQIEKKIAQFLIQHDK